MRRAALVPLALLAGCSGIQTPLAPAGDQAAALSSLMTLMMIVCVPVYLLVIGGLGWSIWRARKQRGAAAGAKDGTLNRALHVASFAIVAGLTVLIVGTFIADRALFAHRTEEAMLVRVTGHQWWWRVQYRDPATGRWIETANELHLPIGRTTRVSLGTADVIHSFWVPNVAGKLDMIPGRDNAIDLTPRRAGWFRGQCAEFCGAQHAHMAFDVKVESEPAFRTWLADQAKAAAPPADPVAARGAAIVAQGACGACHAVRGTAAAGRAGPDLTHIATRRSIGAGVLAMTRGNLQGWIVQPQAVKPGTSMPAVPLTPRDANAVAQYLATLR